MPLTRVLILTSCISEINQLRAIVLVDAEDGVCSEAGGSVSLDAIISVAIHDLSSHDVVLGIPVLKVLPEIGNALSLKGLSWHSSEHVESFMTPAL